MLIPGTVYLIVNNYMPMLGLVIAFKKVNRYDYVTKQTEVNGWFAPFGMCG